MFGYVKTDLPNMFVKDTVLYKSLYCGLCKSIGKICGQNGRFTLNYDLAFLSAFVHNVVGVDIKVEKQHCVIHPITKRPVAVVDEISEKIGALNVILAYYKLCDDVIDEGKGKIKRSFISRSYKRAKKMQPELDSIVKNGYKELRKYEAANCDSIDMAADSFATIMRDAVRELTGERYSDAVGTFAYMLGKWVYLIDALDDFDEDRDKKRYNVFVNAYPSCVNKNEFCAEYKNELEEIFGTLLCDLAESSMCIEYKFNHDLIDNVIDKGLKEKTKKIMENGKCKKITKS